MKIALIVVSWLLEMVLWIPLWMLASYVCHKFNWSESAAMVLGFFMFPLLYFIEDVRSAIVKAFIQELPL